MPLTSRSTIMAELLGSLGWRAPFRAQQDLAATIADAYEVPIASGVINQALALPPGLVTITTLWISANKSVGITLGPVASNQAKTLNAGGVIGFANGALAATGAASITYSAADGQPATVLVYVAGS